MSKEYKDKGYFVGHEACIAEAINKVRPNGEIVSCDSSDAMAIYEHDAEDGSVWYDSYCFSCCTKMSKNDVHNSDLGEDLGVIGGVVVNRKAKERLPDADPMTRKEVGAFIKEHTYKSGNYRGIKDKYSKFYGHMVKVDGDGTVLARLYPETQKRKGVVGYKCRNHPKDFTYGKLGLTGGSCELSGQCKFKEGGKYLLIVGGEEDKVAAYQIFAEAALERGLDDFNTIPVVSPTAGEGSAANQIAANYDFCDMYDIIIIGMDNDEAGREAAAKAAECLPREKVRIALWSGKDPNQMLNDGTERQFLRDFYGAKEYFESDIKSSAGSMDRVRDVLLATKVTLPPYMTVMEQNMRRAFSTAGKLVNIIGDTSVGKSTHVNNLAYHWMFQEGLRPFIISLEKTEGEFALDILSIHLEKNLGWFKKGQDAVDYLDRDDVQALYKNLFVDDYGQERWRILDERDGKIAGIERQIERAVKQYGCNIIIFDVLTDAVRFLPQEEQEKHLQWQKMFIKTGVSIVNVLHTTKPKRDKDGKMIKTTMYDAYGTSSFVQSAHINIVINRDKMAEGLEKHTTYVDMPKCREGDTGPAGEWIYDSESAKLYDSEDYMANVYVDTSEDDLMSGKEDEEDSVF